MKSPSRWLLYSCVSPLFPSPPPFLFKHFLTLWRKLFQTHLLSPYAIHGINHFSKLFKHFLLDNGVKIWAIGTFTATGVFLSFLNRARKYMCVYWPTHAQTPVLPYLCACILKTELILIPLIPIYHYRTHFILLYFLIWHLLPNSEKPSSYYP